MPIIKNRSIIFMVLMLAYFDCFADTAFRLSSLIGYTIVSSDMVSKTFEDNYGNKFVKLLSGSLFKVDLLILDPLPASTVIIFSKNKSYKILIDDDVYSATPEKL